MEDNIFVKASRQMLTGMFDFDGDMNDKLHQGHTDGVRGGPGLDFFRTEILSTYRKSRDLK